MNNEITIKDVARAANVSISTVSRVLNGLDRVSEHTRDKVMRVVEELGYVPNSIAISMVKKRTKMIVVMVPDIINPFYTSVIQGAEAVTKANGYFTFVFSTNDCLEEERDFLGGIMAKGVDGIITISSSKDYSFYRKLSKPIVTVDRYVDGYEIDGVVIDNYGGSYQACNHLIENGHRNIAIINGPRDFNIGNDRFRGYSDALRNHGIPINEDFIKSVKWDENDGYTATKQLMMLPNPPTAIFASNNLLCMGVIRAARDLELTLGNQLSLVGFDDNVLANFSIPSVSVIDRPTYEMGKQAAELLINKIGNKHLGKSGNKIVLNTHLISRGSVRKI